MNSKSQDIDLQNQSKAHSPYPILKNFVFLLIARLIDVIGQFAPLYLIPRYLGPTSYGDYGFAIAFATIPISFTYWGLDRILTREIAKNQKAAGDYLGAAIIARWFYLAMVLPLVFLATYFMNLSPRLIAAIWLAVLAYNFMGDAYMNLAMFKAFEKMRLDTLLSVIYQTLNIGFVLLVIYLDLGFLGLFWGLIATQFLRCLLAYLISMHWFVKPVFNQKISLVKFFVQETYVFGSFVLLNQLLINVELLALKYFHDSYAVSMFYAPYTLILATSIFSNSFLTAIYPTLSRAAVQDKETLRLMYEKSSRIIVFFAFLVFLPFFTLSDTIIPLVFGKEFYPAIPSFQILCLAMIFVMLTFVFDFPLSAINKQNVLIYCTLGALITKIILSLFLIPPFGYIGASISAVGGYLVFFIIGYLLATKFIVRLPILWILLKPTFCVLFLICSLSLLGLRHSLPVTALSLIIYCLLLWLLRFFTADEIIFCKSVLNKFLPLKSTT